MADYWKSNEKKYCEVCSCWLLNNKSCIEFHENGKRHKENVEKRLKDIYQKTKIGDKKAKKLENELRLIEEAAKSACEKDTESNPDLSMKIQAFTSALGTSTSENESSSTPTAPKILHRSEKEKKTDEAIISNLNKPPSQPYSRFGGWQTIEPQKAINLELPTSSNSSEPVEYIAKPAPKRKPIEFQEKTISSIQGNTSSTTNISSNSSEVSFKKRKFSKANVRRREDTNE